MAAAGRHFHYHRVLHADTAVGELRELLRGEWGTCAVVAGLFVLLAGASATSAPEAALGHEVPTAARWVFVGANTLAYIGAASSAFASVALIHFTNSVPEAHLHAFLHRVHHVLWVPLGGIVVDRKSVV